MDFKNPQSAPAAKLLAKMASDVREIIQDDESTDAQDLLKMHTSVMRVTLAKNVKIATLANVAAALGYEVILRFREKAGA